MAIRTVKYNGMKSFRAFSLLVAVLLCSAHATPQKIIFSKVPVSEDNFGTGIKSIVQDRDGYMWFSSIGISKFDGYQLTHFVNDPLNSNSISSNNVACIYADTSDGSIWIGTNKGLDKLNPSANTFIHYKHQFKNAASLCSDTVTAITKDKDNFFWVGTGNGLDRFDPVAGKFEHFRADKKNTSSLSSNRINAMLTDHEGSLWICTGAVADENKNAKPEDEGGLCRYDKKSNNFIQYKIDAADQRSPADNHVYALFEDSKNNLWLGAGHNRLFGMDRDKGTISYYPADMAKGQKISAPAEKKNVQGAPDHISFINEDAAGGIWIGTMANGINRFDPALNKTAHFESDNAAQFPDNNGYCAFSSRDGLFWICTKEGNLYKIDPILNTIPRNSANGSVFAIYGDANNVLWIGTSNGLIQNDRKNGKTELFANDLLNPSSLSNNKVFAIYEDHENRLWLGTNGGGLNLFNRSSRNFTSFLHDNNNKQSLIHDVVYSICEDKEKNLWVGTENGLDLMDQRTRTFIHYLHNSKDTASIGNNFITTIIKDNNNENWIGSGYKGGVNKFVKSTGKFQHFLKDRSIFSLFQDYSNTIWAGTDSGLYFMNPSSPSFDAFIDSNLDIGSTTIIRIVEDAQKKLWLNTSLGIIELDNKRNVIGLYGKRYGVVPTSYVLRGAYASPQGQLFFSANDGYYSFGQSSLVPNLKQPRLLVTGFRLMDQYIKPGDGGPLTEEITNTKSLKLNYKQNIFSFDFAALDYISPEDNQHFFMLENYDNGWHKAGTDRKAYFFSVPPGHYVFRVRGLNANGFVSEKKIDIVLSPPWWQTWWAYTLFAAAFGGAVWGFIYYRGRRLQNENRLLEDTVRKRTLQLQESLEELKSTQAQLVQSEKMASLGELTAGIAHEIQNPLNFVNNFSDVNKELIDEMAQEMDNGNLDDAKAIAKDIKANEEKINHHGRRADAIVKGMLQHSRSSTGQKEPTNINALTDEYLRLSYHGLRAKDKSFNATMKTDFDESIVKINIIAQDIGRVLLNLYNNAFYAVTEKKKQIAEGRLPDGKEYEPTVSVTTKKINGRIEIRVSDNGSGIPQKALDKIFQPFFTTKPTGQGTGLGLSLTYDIIKAHKGEIKVETKEGEGTAMIVLLPA